MMKKKIIIPLVVAVIATAAIGGVAWKRAADVKAEEARIEALEKSADAIEGKINAIGTVKLDSEPAITSARTAYDSADPAVQEKVENFDTLTKAEKDYSALKEADEADAEAAKAVDDKIAAIGTVTAESSDAVTAARTAYDSLNDNAQGKVTKYADLEKAEADLITAKAEAERAKEIAEAEARAKAEAEAAAQAEAEAKAKAAKNAKNTQSASTASGGTSASAASGSSSKKKSNSNSSSAKANTSSNTASAGNSAAQKQEAEQKPAEDKASSSAGSVPAGMTPGTKDGYSGYYDSKGGFDLGGDELLRWARDHAGQYGIGD